MPLHPLRKIGGPESDAGSGFKGGFASVAYRLGGSENVTVEVNNVLVNREIHNVFGVIKGFTDPGTAEFLIIMWHSVVFAAHLNFCCVFGAWM